MSPAALLFIGIVATMLMAVFVYISFREVRTTAPGVPVVHGLLPVAESLAPLEPPLPRPMKVLVAVDGSPCSDRAVQSVAMRPWPDGTQVQVVSVVHTRMPAVPDPLLMVEAAHVNAREADRARAPQRVQRAEACLAAGSGITVSSRVLEGHPAEVILAEAERWRADLVVVGSHGFGPVTRRVLGSVSQAVALHAGCSVEIVRCPHDGIPIDRPGSD
jgi:nucleotide-binding universal stress UspA family protein